MKKPLPPIPPELDHQPVTFRDGHWVPARIAPRHRDTYDPPPPHSDDWRDPDGEYEPGDAA